MTGIRAVPTRLWRQCCGASQIPRAFIALGSVLWLTFWLVAGFRIELPRAHLATRSGEAVSHILRAICLGLVAACWNPFGLAGELLWRKPPGFDNIPLRRLNWVKALKWFGYSWNCAAGIICVISSIESTLTRVHRLDVIIDWVMCLAFLWISMQVGNATIRAALRRQRAIVADIIATRPRA